MVFDHDAIPGILAFVGNTPGTKMQQENNIFKRSLFLVDLANHSEPFSYLLVGFFYFAILMKIYVLLLLVVVAIGACCKCDIPPTWHGFRFVNSAGKDLVFGPDKKYKSDSILFYYVVKVDSIRRDTIKHVSRAVATSSGMPDSVLGVSFKVDGNDTSFVDFGNGDIDTLILKYNHVDGDCCEYVDIIPTLYNNKPVAKNDWIIITK